MSFLIYQIKVQLLERYKQAFSRRFAQDAIRGNPAFRVSLLPKTELRVQKSYLQPGWKRYFPPSPSMKSGDLPLISCVMVVADPQQSLHLAIQCFLTQTYPHKELVIVAPQPEPAIEAAISSLPNVQLHYPGASTELSLDQLQALALEKAGGSYICQWQADHLAHPLRLEGQMGALQSLQAEVCFCVRLLLYDSNSQAFAVSGYRTWEHSFLGHKRLLTQYPCQYLGCESSSIVNLSYDGAVALLDRPHLYTALVPDLTVPPTGYGEPNPPLSEQFDRQYYPEMQALWLKQLAIDPAEIPLISPPMRPAEHPLMLKKPPDRISLACPDTWIQLEPEADAISPEWFKSPAHKVPNAVGIVIAAYNRSHYLELTLNTLKASQLDNVVICLIDDASQNPKTIHLIQQFEQEGVSIYKIFKSQNRGISHSLRLAWDFLAPHCRYLCNLDSDTLVKPNWLSTLKHLHEQYALEYPQHKVIATGFHTSNHKTLKQTEAYRVKQTIGGVNLFFQTALYKRYVREALTDAELWDFSTIEKLYHWPTGTARNVQQGNQKPPAVPETAAILCTRPSVIQHLGAEGYHGSLYNFDVAEDY